RAHERGEAARGTGALPEEDLAARPGGAVETRSGGARRQGRAERARRAGRRRRGLPRARLRRTRDGAAPRSRPGLDAGRLGGDAQLAYLAQVDPLTGLANRTLLSDRFSLMIVQARRRNASLGVLFIDLDDFKMVNDTQGHAAGDELLKETARRLQSALRD